MIGRSTTYRIAMVAAAVLSLTLSADAARIISVNVNEAGTDGDNPPLSRTEMSASDLAGAPGVRVANWNNYKSGSSNLPAEITSPNAGTFIYSDGTPVGGTFAMTANAGSGFANTNSLINDPRMFSGSHGINSNTGNATGTFTFTDIPFAQYDIYVYAQGQNVAGANFRGGSVQLVGGQIYYQQGSGSPADDGTGYVHMSTTSVDGDPEESEIAFGNYVAYTGLTGSSQTVDVVGYLWTDFARFNVAGFQIVEVPEPASIALFGFGGLVLLRRRR